MRTLRGLLGLVTILFSAFIILILWFFYLLLINDIFDGGGLLAGGGFAMLPILSIAPILLVGGIIALAKRDKKIGTIIAGLFFIGGGFLSIYNAALYTTDAFFIYIGYGYMALGALFIVTALLQKGMTLQTTAGKKMVYQQPNQGVQTFGPSHLPVQTYGQYQQPAQAVAPTNNVGGWVCSCGTINEKSAKFCTTCGKINPVLESWTCACGTVNPKDAKFCKSCGKPKL